METKQNSRMEKLGSAAAGKQLLLLADNSSEPVIPADVRPEFWQDVRSRIRVERLIASPGRKSLSDTPRIRMVEGFATPAECQWVIDAAYVHLAPATVRAYQGCACRKWHPCRWGMRLARHGQRVTPAVKAGRAMWAIAELLAAA